jgi:hypothetical protein
VVDHERGAQEIDLELDRPPRGNRRFSFEFAATIDTQHHWPSRVTTAKPNWSIHLPGSTRRAPARPPMWTRPPASGARRWVAPWTLAIRAAVATTACWRPHPMSPSCRSSAWTTARGMPLREALKAIAEPRQRAPRYFASAQTHSKDSQVRRVVAYCRDGSDRVCSRLG